MPPHNAPLKRNRDVLKWLSIAALILLPCLWTWELLIAENSASSALLLYLPQHIFLLAPIVFSIWALCKRRWNMIALNGLSLALCLLPLGWQFHLPSRTTRPTVRLVTFNVQRGEGDLARVKAALEAFHPDIICVQESGRSRHPWKNEVGHNIASAFPGWSTSIAGDVTTISRFSLVSKRVYPLVGTRRTLETVFQTPGGPLRVLNTHVSTAFSGVRKTTSKLDHAAFVFETARPAAQVRLAQLPALRHAIEGGDAKTPLVLVGDFNTPPRGHFYGGLAQHMDDAFAYVGNGLGLTFPSRLPLLRIDYVWTHGATARHAFVGAPSGADHRPLIADIEVGS